MHHSCCNNDKFVKEQPWTYNFSLIYSNGSEEVSQISDFSNRFGIKTSMMVLSLHLFGLVLDLDYMNAVVHFVTSFVNFRPLVPAVSAEDGQWLVTRPFIPVCKPGGHGVIWKLAYDKGIFQWFRDHGRKGATVWQVRLAAAIYLRFLHIFFLLVSQELIWWFSFSFSVYFNIYDFVVMWWLLQIWPCWRWQGLDCVIKR